jgi:hypothetical protein
MGLGAFAFDVHMLRAVARLAHRQGFGNARDG